MTGFDVTRIPEGRSLSFLEQKFLPLYFHHRYQLQAAVKSIGGQYYTYAVRKGTAPSPAPTSVVAPEAQRAALAAVLETLSPDVLVVPDRVLALLQPRTGAFGGFNTEMFPRRTGLTFDPAAAAAIAADMTISALLNHERAARLLEFQSRDPKQLGLAEVIRDTASALRPGAQTGPAAAHALRAAQSVFVMRLMDLGVNEAASADVRAVAQSMVADLPALLVRAGATPQGQTWRAHLAAIDRDVKRYAQRPYSPYTPQKPLAPPPGDPIGQP